MVKVIWTSYAMLDLKEIFDYIGKDSKRYAYIHVSRLKDKTNILKRNPRCGRVVPEIDRKDIRELIVGDYRIIYRIKSNTRIDIITVIHSAQMLDIGNSI